MENAFIAEHEIYSVSRLNAEARALLEDNFPLVWLQGELSNLARPASGHLYFSLKDDFAQIRCAMFRRSNHTLGFAPKDGTEVLVKAEVSLYVQRGDYQLIIHHMEEAGDGKLQQRFERLKQKLKKEGLFDEKNKQPLPEFPQHIGIVTSPTGAAVHDILHVLKRRFPCAAVIIYPTQVQGATAAGQIVHAIEKANQRAECDVLIVARGGGSLEDLWPFNEEMVARSLFDSKIPIVSGVGHEVDFTIADFVADKRAATPSAAAELITPDISDWHASLNHSKKQLIHFIKNYLRMMNERCLHLEKRLQHPGRRLQALAQGIDQLELRLIHAQRRSHKTMKEKLSSLSRALDAISPLSTLDRGYSITSVGDRVVRNAKSVKIGDIVTTRLAKGIITSEVK